LEQQSPPQSSAPVPGPVVPPGYELKKKGHTGRNLGIGCAGIIGLFIVIGIAVSAANQGGSGTSSPAASDNNATASSPAAHKSSPVARQPQVLLDKTGNGINNTASFSASGAWEIDYSFDCTNFGQSGNFAITVKNSDGSYADLPVNSLATKGQDVSHESKGGTYSLEINSECDWHVIVKG
jgi:hypothetical protein